MHGPVCPPRLTELPGAVQGIYYPDAFGRQPRRIVRPFFRQDGVGRAQPLQLGNEEFMRLPVTRLLQPGGVAGLVGPARSKGQEPLTGGRGEIASQRVICSQRWLPRSDLASLFSWS
jgi:hypothetical protein